MSNGIVLNHHSLPFINQEEADKELLVFFKVLKFCRAAGLKVLLIDEDQDKSLMSLELADDYFIRTWYVAANKNPELADWRLFLQSVETKQPLFEKVDLETIGDAIEVGLQGDRAGKGVLLAAFHFDTFMASFVTVEPWIKSHIDVWVFELGVDPDKESAVLNLCGADSLVVHGEELMRRRNELINSAKDIWLHRDELFPNLTLLPNQIGTSLQNWSGRQDILLKARDALNVLEGFCERWKNGIYTDYRHEHLRALGLAAEVSGESQSVNNNPKKKSERLFWLEDGRHVNCENHVKLPDSYRMHFYPDSVAKCIYVAYLGPHLAL